MRKFPRVVAIVVIATAIGAVQYLYPSWRIDASAQGYPPPPPPPPEPTSPVCEIEMSQPSYVNGETVTANLWRISNPTDRAIPVELKSWVVFPGVARVPITRFGADGSVVLDSGAQIELGPQDLFTVNANHPPGTYAFSCRLLNPVTGRTQTANRNAFQVN